MEPINQIYTKEEFKAQLTALGIKAGDTLVVHTKMSIERIIKQDNVKWWHRNKERSGFFINGALNHYPDFIVMTQRGNVILIETKGKHLKMKIVLGSLN